MNNFTINMFVWLHNSFNFRLSHKQFTYAKSVDIDAIMQSELLLELISMNANVKFSIMAAQSSQKVVFN